MQLGRLCRFFFFQAEDGIRDLVRSRGLGDVYKRQPLKSAGPSTPVTVTGFKVLPQFGDVFTTVKNEREARLLVERARQEAEKFAASTNVTGADLLKLMTQKHDTQELNAVSYTHLTLPPSDLV